MNSTMRNGPRWTTGRRPSHETIACPTCDTYQTVEVDYDDDQGYDLFR